MTSLAFLSIAVGVFVIGSFIVWFRARDRTTFDTSIDNFRSQLGALAPDERHRGDAEGTERPSDDRGGTS